jgi:hypothetical protein
VDDGLAAEIEARIYAHYILKTQPDAKIAVLYQNDDFGKDYFIGLHEGLGDKADQLIVASQSYETTDPTVDPQISSLQGSGANVLLTAALPKIAAQAASLSPPALAISLRSSRCNLRNLMAPPLSRLARSSLAPAASRKKIREAIARHHKRGLPGGLFGERAGRLTSAPTATIDTTSAGMKIHVLM